MDNLGPIRRLLNTGVDGHFVARRVTPGAEGGSRCVAVVGDTVDHDLPAALLTAAEAAANRNSRRNYDGLLDHAAAVDSAISTLSPDGGFVKRGGRKGGSGLMVRGTWWG